MVSPVKSVPSPILIMIRPRYILVYFAAGTHTALCVESSTPATWVFTNRHLQITGPDIMEKEKALAKPPKRCGTERTPSAKPCTTPSARPGPMGCEAPGRFARFSKTKDQNRG